MDKPGAVKSAFCTQCGAAANAGRFCQQCGAAYPDAPTQAPSAADVPPTEDDGWIRLAGAEPASTPSLSSPPPFSPAPSVAITPEQPFDQPAYEQAAFEEAEPRRGISVWWLAIGAIVLLAVAGVAWKNFSDIRPVGELAPEDPAEKSADAPAANWQDSYADQFLSQQVDMVVRGGADRRNLPASEGTQLLGRLDDGATISGRWVRGHIGTTRWLKLADGSYVAEAQLVQPGSPDAPMTLPFSNNRAAFGAQVDAYLQRLVQQIQARAEQYDDLPEEERAIARDQLFARSHYMPVPNRRFHGVTLTGVAQHYEGRGILFREEASAVIAALREAGVKVADDGSIPMAEDVVEGCAVQPVKDEGGSRIGASELNCGV